MKSKYLLITVMLIFSSVVAFSQANKMKFGKIEDDEIKLMYCTLDTTASAVILGENTQVKFTYSGDDGFSFEQERHVRIKIFNKNGYDEANQSINFYSPESSGGGEVIIGLKAYTYNAVDGQIIKTKLEKEGIFEVVSNKSWKKIKFTMPDVKEGSIIEFKYTLKSPYIRYLRDWYFQYHIPLMDSYCEIKIPEFFNYNIRQQGYESLLSNNQSRTSENFSYTYRQEATPGINGTPSSRQAGSFTSLSTVYTYVAKDIPAFIEEPNMTSEKDYIAKMEFELQSTKYPNSIAKNYVTDWLNVGETYLGFSTFGDQLKGNAFAKNIIEGLKIENLTHIEKIDAICTYLKYNILWDGYNSETSSGIKEAYQNKKGTSGDINLLLVVLLDKAGIDVSPVVLSTRENGFLREMSPNSENFNYVLACAKIGDSHILCDATDPHLPNSLIPEKCLNYKGLLIQKGHSRLIDINQSVENTIKVSANLTLTEDATLTGTISKNLNGYYGRNHRREILSMGEQKFKDNIFEKSIWELDSINISELKNYSKPLSIVTSGSLEDGGGSLGGTIYLSPIFELKQSENYFKSDIRKYPVDFGCPESKTYFAQITLPKGYVIIEKPENAIIALPEKSARFTYTISQMGNVITIISKLDINKSMFVQNEYPYLKQFFDIIVAKHAEQIVLKKA